MARIECFHFYVDNSPVEQQLFVPWDCSIVGVDFALAALGATDATSLVVYLSTVDLENTYTTGLPGLVASCRMSISVGAAGIIVSEANKYVQIPEPGVKLRHGQFVQAGVGVNGAITLLGNVVVHLRVQ